MNVKKISIIVLFLVAAVMLFIPSGKKAYVKIEGMTFGTYYHITYHHPEGKNLSDTIGTLLKAFDNSLSTYNANSLISAINNNRSFRTDTLFRSMFRKAEMISRQTDGAFDITVAPLVNAWGFGYETDSVRQLSQQTVDSMLKFTGYEKVKLTNERIIKADPRVKLDASAIAKGLSVDIVAAFLESAHVTDYMVEIGGELRVHGKNPKGNKWMIGIDLPEDDPYVLNRKLIERIAITDKAMATSGNYRNFYVKNGVKYSHTINPVTGYPVTHNLLSASVISNDCMTADALATACMVLGVEKSLNLVKMNKNTEIYLIYSDENGNMKTVFSEGFKDYTQGE